MSIWTSSTLYQVYSALMLSGCKPVPRGGRIQAHCPAHKDRVPSLSVAKHNERILVKCFAGCDTATVLTALGLTWNDLYSENSHECQSERRHLIQVARKPQPATVSVPVPAQVAHQAREWQEDLVHNPLALDYLWCRRGISEGTALDWGVGVKDLRMDAAGLVFGATWTFPILIAEAPRRIAGFKCHVDPKPVRGPKCYWVPAGVQQTGLLFPLPEAQELRPRSKIILAPGELKALRHIDAGNPATSRTAGESVIWPASLANRFRNLTVILDPDRDGSKAARTFVERAHAALHGVAHSVEVLK